MILIESRRQHVQKPQGSEIAFHHHCALAADGHAGPLHTCVGCDGYSTLPKFMLSFADLWASLYLTLGLASCQLISDGRHKLNESLYFNGQHQTCKAYAQQTHSLVRT